MTFDDVVVVPAPSVIFLVSFSVLISGSVVTESIVAVSFPVLSVVFISVAFIIVVVDTVVVGAPISVWMYSDGIPGTDSTHFSAEM